jgi:eukaryotic-like serine/threonine-protein kinase
VGSRIETDRNLLFGVLALQADLIDSRQFIDACTLWTTRKSTPLADVLLENGWLEPTDRSHVEYLVERKMQKHGGDPKASLALAPDEIKRSLAALGDVDIHRSLADLPRPDGTSSATTVSYIPEKRLRYRLDHLHATGGLGRIWLAHDSEFGRDVALKELRPEQSDNVVLRRRFLREAQITGQLEHPGIVPVYELSHWDDEQEPFYTMRFIKGRTLTEAVESYHTKREKGDVEPLDFVALLNAFVTVCNTIAYAHSRGIIHRDLKGQNVVVGDFGEVVVLDWGLAKALDGSEAELSGYVDDAFSAGAANVGLTIQGQTLGTPAYMAPEQARGRVDEIDARTDVYGLGAMLYEVLTGHAPFSGSDTREVLKNVCEKEPTPPRSLSADIPLTLETVCLRALAKNPADRYASAAELSQEVQQWQEVQRKQAEDALRASEHRFRMMTEQLPAMTAIFQGTGHAYANPTSLATMGYSWEELRQLSFVDYVHPDFRPTVMERSVARQRGDKADSRYEIPLVSKDGRNLWVDFAAVPIEYEGKPAILGIGIDITERKAAEEALRASERRFRTMVEVTPTMVAIIQGTGHVYLNPAAAAMVGYSREELLRLNFLDYVHPDFRPLALERFQTRMRGEPVPSRYEMRLVAKDGRDIWVDFAFATIEYEGKPAVLALGIDITQRKDMEEALRASEALYHSLVETLPLSVWRKDLDGRVTFANRAWCEASKRSLSEAIGKTDFDMFPPELAEKYQRDDAWVIVKRKRFDATEQHVTADGENLSVRVVKIPICNATGEVVGTQGIFWDVSDRKRLEENLERAMAERDELRRRLER